MLDLEQLLRTLSLSMVTGGTHACGALSTGSFAIALTRILSVGESKPSPTDPSNDMEWRTLVELRVVAHPELPPTRRATIERDYGMYGGVLTIKTRAALAFYLISHLNLDLDSTQIPPARKQISLTNLVEVANAVHAAKGETQARMGSGP